MAEEKRKQRICYCARGQFRRNQRRKKEQCKRKRQTFVYNPEEEVWHEPYMKDLRKEFSAVSMLCDSKIELPWKDIALPTAGMRIRKEVSSHPIDEQRLVEEQAEEPAKRESIGMVLPWQDLIITDTIQTAEPTMENCDSSLEIPWDELTLEQPVHIHSSPNGETCDDDDVEIPWDDILIPRNIIIEPQMKKQHPSSKRPPRTLAGMTCIQCKLCCGKVGCRMRPTTSCN